MIPFDFIYCRADTLREAADAYTELCSEGKTAVYYAGGSEIITMSRAGAIKPDAVIDIKQIPEGGGIAADGGGLRIGAFTTLSQIARAERFPLLGLACGRIADHTNQCRITLGGNLCGTIMYRETALPLLLSDAEATLYGPAGERTVPFENIFRGRMLLNPGELLVSVHIPDWALGAGCAHIKKTTNDKIDYPLVSVSALVKDGFLRAAFSGVCSFPFRSGPIESVLNNCPLSCRARADIAANLLPEAARSSVEGSRAYRLFVLQNTLAELLEDWENGKI